MARIVQPAAFPHKSEFAPAIEHFEEYQLHLPKSLQIKHIIELIAIGTKGRRGKNFANRTKVNEDRIPRLTTIPVPEQEAVKAPFLRLNRNVAQARQLIAVSCTLDH